MRLNPSTIGLLAYLSGAFAEQNGRATEESSIQIAATPTTTNNFVTYSATLFPTRGAVFSAYDGSDAIINWDTKNDATVTGVRVYKTNGNGDNGTTIAYGNVTSSVDGRSMKHSGITDGKRRTGEKAVGVVDPHKQIFEIPVTATSASLTIMSEPSLWNDHFDEILYLEMLWVTQVSSGSSFSPVFAVTELPPERERDLHEKLDLQVGSGHAPYRKEASNSDILPPSASSPTVANHPSPTESSSSSSSQSETAVAASSGLSTGAAAGIGAGVGVAALAVIGVLLWFFCVRRRRRRGDAAQHHHHPGASYTSDSGVGVMMPDKEAAGISESSPQSAYGDDGARFVERSSLALHSAPHDEASPYAPYTDTAAAAATTTTRTAQSSIELTRRQASSESAPINGMAGTATPPVASRYAHLIEEGMTEDEIRRLEEEERHLDAAIEQAGSRQSHARP